MKFQLKPNLWYFRALLDIVPNDTGPPILVWRDSNEKNTSGYTTGKYSTFSEKGDQLENCDIIFIF